MKYIYMLIASVAFALNLSAQTIVFNVQEIKANATLAINIYIYFILNLIYG